MNFLESASLLIVVGVFLFVVIFFLINYLLANEFYKVAVMKGHPQRKYLWLTFFLGLFGILLVIALPNHNRPAPPSPSLGTKDGRAALKAYSDEESYRIKKVLDESSTLK